MERWTKKTVFIQAEESDIEAVEKQARRAARGSADHIYLVSWWNRNNNSGGPAVAVINALPKTIRNYAESRGADVRVSVNRDEYEFYYLTSTADLRGEPGDRERTAAEVPGEA